MQTFLFKEIYYFKCLKESLSPLLPLQLNCIWKQRQVLICFLCSKTVLNFAGLFGRKGNIWLLFSVLFSLFIYLYSGSVEVHLRPQEPEDIHCVYFWIIDAFFFTWKSHDKCFNISYWTNLQTSFILKHISFCDFVVFIFFQVKLLNFEEVKIRFHFENILFLFTAFPDDIGYIFSPRNCSRELFY